MTRHTVLTIGGLLAATLTGAFAEPVPEPQPESDPLVVVVSKSQSDLNPAGDRAVSISTLDRDDVRTQGIDSLRDLPRHVPNLAASHGGIRSYSDTYMIRGVGNTQFLSDPGVALYVDDVPFGDPASYVAELYNIASVSTYRGPQPGRFGRNGPAGVIDIATPEPTGALSGEATAGWSRFDTRVLGANLQGALVPGWLDGSASARYEDSDGYIWNDTLQADADRTEARNARGRLRWSVDDDWRVDAFLTADDFHDGILLVPLEGPERRTSADFQGEADTQADGQAVRVRGLLDGLDVLSVSSRRYWRLDPFSLDLDMSPFPGNVGITRREQTQWSQEFRLGPRDAEGRWNWLAGAFASRADTDGDVDLVAVVDPASGATFRDRTLYQLDSDTAATFGELSYAATPGVTVTAGGRLDATKKYVDREKVTSAGSSPPIHAEDTFWNAAPRVGFSMAAREHVSFYGSSALGFKPGGFSPYADPDGAFTFDTERTWANELGLRSSCDEGRVSLRVAAFDYEISDYQVEQPLPSGADVTIVNAEAVTSRGVEAELSARVLSRLTLAAQAAYTDIEFDRFIDPLSGMDNAGKRPPFVPSFTSALRAQYDATARLSGSLAYTLLGETYYSADNDPRLKEPSHGLLDARASYAWSRFRVSVFVENITDEDYFTKRVPGLYVGAPGQPRSAGVQFSAAL